MQQEVGGAVVLTQTHANVGHASSGLSDLLVKVVLSLIKVQHFLCIRADI